MTGIIKKSFHYGYQFKIKKSSEILIISMLQDPHKHFQKSFIFQI